uniref:Uncharacterized protein n=1 Tax=Zea mays TaxID=4577 RepID=C4J042_MAIZE|nr:unknown [Zea mays]
MYMFAQITCGNGNAPTDSMKQGPEQSGGERSQRNGYLLGSEEAEVGGAVKQQCITRGRPARRSTRPPRRARRPVATRRRTTPTASWTCGRRGPRPPTGRPPRAGTPVARPLAPAPVPPPGRRRRAPAAPGGCPW